MDFLKGSDMKNVCKPLHLGNLPNTVWVGGWVCVCVCISCSVVSDSL